MTNLLSPAGQPDTPDSYHTFTVELAEHPGGTGVLLSHSEKNWSGMLAGLKKLLET